MPSPTGEAIDDYKQRFGLSGLIVIPSQPENPSHEARRRWFVDFVHRLPTGQVPEVAQKILGAEYQTLTRGKADEYFLVYPVPSRGMKYLLIVSINSPELAYLDDAGDTVLGITIFTTLLIISTYYLLVRFIFRPFRELRKEAVESGRVVVDAENEAEAMVEDYRRIIAELKQKELKLISRADSLEQFNNYLLHSTNSGIITLDRDGRILSINEAAAALLGIDPAQSIGRTAEPIFERNSIIGRALDHALRTKTNQPYDETEVNLADGSKINIGFIISTVSDDQRQPIGAAIIITDINEITRLRHELEAKNRLAALGEMSGGLAHQLRNSMGTIVGYCNLLKKQMTAEEHGREYFDDLFGEIKETESLVKRFLSFARPLQFQPEEIDLLSTIEEVIESQKSAANAANIGIQFYADGLGQSYSDRRLLVQADPLLMKQALSNIIDNAIAACQKGAGAIGVTLKKTDNAISVSITDNGRGIPENDLQKVFTPFFSSKPSGTGLGLPLAAKIVDLHGGRIAVESQVGVGTTFRIDLPLQILASAHPVHS
jgi:PAS domain S-box-containing protein